MKQSVMCRVFGMDTIFVNHRGLCIYVEDSFIFVLYVCVWRAQMLVTKITRKFI